MDEFEYLINSTIEAIFILKENKIVDVNQSGIKLFGYEKKAELLNRTPLELVPQDSLDTVENNLKNEDITYEANCLKKDGTIFPVLIQGRTFKLKNETIRLSCIIDLTELREKDRQLSEHRKMVALGEMLGNIAHQWRQPLSVISTAASGVKIQKEMNMLNDDVFYDSMDGIVKNANYLSATIEDFRGFLHEEKIKSNFLLRNHIDKDLTILQGMLKLNNIEVNVDMDETIMLYTIENELTQAIINIMNNSRDAFEENQTAMKYIFINATKVNNRVKLFLKDNAGGIPLDIIDKVFEPYFSTKHKKQGTGFGLYMTSQIITESMKGEIEVKNVVYDYLGKQYKGAELIHLA